MGSTDSDTGERRIIVRNRQELHNGEGREQPVTDFQTPTVNLEYRANLDGFPTDAMWRAWMDRHLATANKWYDKGHPKVVEPFRLENAHGKRNRFLGLPYWLPDANSVATPSTPSSEPASAANSYDSSTITRADSPPVTPSLDVSIGDAPWTSAGA